MRLRAGLFVHLCLSIFDSGQPPTAAADRSGTDLPSTPWLLIASTRPFTQRSPRLCATKIAPRRHTTASVAAKTSCHCLFTATASWHGRFAQSIVTALPPELAPASDPANRHTLSTAACTHPHVLILRTKIPILSTKIPTLPAQQKRVALPRRPSVAQQQCCLYVSFTGFARQADNN